MIIDVSSISTIKVDSPREMLSVAPTRVKILSKYPIRTESAGTNDPTCAISTINAVCRRRADFPAMFGPVRIIIWVADESRCTSFGTYSSPGAIRVSMTGWRPALMSSTLPESTTGRQYLRSMACTAKPERTSSCETTSQLALMSRMLFCTSATSAA